MDFFPSPPQKLHLFSKNLKNKSHKTHTVKNVLKNYLEYYFYLCRLSHNYLLYTYILMLRIYSLYSLCFNRRDVSKKSATMHLADKSINELL